MSASGVSEHRRLHCLLNCGFRRRSKKTSKLRVTGLGEGNSPVTGEFPAQKASNGFFFSFDDVISTCERSFDNFASSRCYVNTIFNLPYINSPHNMLRDPDSKSEIDFTQKS